MKKILLTLVMMVSLCSGVAWAGEEEKISAKVLNAFKSEFTSAEEVSWRAATNHFEAAFTLGGQRVFAYFSFQGELIGVARYISSLQLPLSLMRKLKNEFTNFWITDLFEVSNSEGTRYFVKLENADTILTLKSSNADEWNTHDKKKKV